MIDKDKIILRFLNLLIDDSKELQDKLQNCIPLLQEVFGVSKCSIMIVHHDTQSLVVMASSNPAIIGNKRKLSDVSISTRALLDDKPLCTDPTRLTFFSPLSQSTYQSAYSINIPFKYLGKKLGVMILTDPYSGESLSPELEHFAVELTQYFAPIVSAHINHFSLIEKTAKYEESLNKRIELDQLKSDLINFIVHDLKGPISTIMANLDLLSYENLTELQSMYLNLSLSDVYKLQRMVSNILDVTKMEEGKLSLYLDEVDLYAIAERVVQSSRVSAKSKSVDVVLDGQPCICCADENLISRVLQNLIYNAIDYSPENSTITVTVQCDEATQAAIVSVADNGMGVPDEHKESIFDKFFQIKTPASNRKSTSGLGLAFCKFAVTAHKGKIWVEDNINSGAVFKFMIPLMCVQEGS